MPTFSICLFDETDERKTQYRRTTDSKRATVKSPHALIVAGLAMLGVDCRYRIINPVNKQQTGLKAVINTLRRY